MFTLRPLALRVEVHSTLVCLVRAKSFFLTLAESCPRPIGEGVGRGGRVDLYVRSGVRCSGGSVMRRRRVTVRREYEGSWVGEEGLW